MTTRKNYGQRINFGREKKIDAVLILISLIFVLGFLYLDSDLTGYAVFQTANSSDFNAGSYNLTFFNVTGFVQLNTTQGYYKGNYTSEIIDGGNPQSWNNISWCEGSSCLNLYGEELPANQKGLRTSSSTDRRINMTGNVLYFRFNKQSEFGETDGRNVTNAIYDFSGSHNNGSLGNNTANTDPTLNVTDCVFGNCYTFDAVNDHIRQDRNLTINNNTFSVSVWFKTTKDCQDSPGMMIIDGMTGRLESGFYISCVDSYGVQARVCDNDAGGGTCSTSSPASPKPLYNGFWHNIAFTRTDGPDSIHKRFLLYIDGILSENLSALHSGLPYDLGKPTIMIGDQVVAKMLFNGSIDEIAVWNRTLAATEIIAIYESGVNNLSLQVRSCNDSGCSGETFVGPDNTANTYFTNATLVELNTTITPNNRWFQYKHLFESNVTGSVNVSKNDTTPELYNITINNNASSNLENINGLVPANNAKFNLSDVIEISVNITDDQAPYPQTVLANITQPNGTIMQLTLTNSTYNNKFNKTFTTELAGRYILKIIANDTDNNVNNTEVTAWDVDSILTFLNRSTSITAWGYLNGIFNNTYFNSSNYSVQLNTSTGKFRGNYTSQIFTIGSNIALNNLSWCESASCLNFYGEELPANQKGGTKSDNRINMTGNLLLLHLNNQSEFGETDSLVYDFSGNQYNLTVTNNARTNTSSIFGNSYHFDGVDDNLRAD